MIKLTVDQELDLVKRYKKYLICPKCQENLVCKDYKVNRKTLFIVILSILLGISVGISVGISLT